MNIKVKVVGLNKYKLKLKSDFEDLILTYDDIINLRNELNKVINRKWNDNCLFFKTYKDDIVSLTYDDVINLINELDEVIKEVKLTLKKRYKNEY